MKLKFYLRLFVSATLVRLAVQYCYEMKLLSFRTTETPDYAFSMVMQSNLTLSSVTRVLKPVAVPLWNLVLVQHNNVRKAAKAEGPKILYNATYKVCEFWKYVKRIRIFNNVAQLLFTKNTGNMSLICPLAVDTYVMHNMHVPPDTPILKFMYWPNTIYSLFGTVYSQHKDKSMNKLCSYEINATVLKSC